MSIYFCFYCEFDSIIHHYISLSDDVIKSALYRDFSITFVTLQYYNAQFTYFLVFSHQGTPVWHQSGSDWPQPGIFSYQIQYIFISVNLTHFGPNLVTVVHR